MGQEPRGEFPEASPSSFSGCAVCFGLACALAAMHRAPRGVAGCGLGARPCRWSRTRELALRDKAGALQLEVEELRRRRSEDARANEKVAGIIAVHEQRWFAERRALRRQLHAVVAAARAREVRSEEAAAELRRQLEEQQRAVGIKDEAMAQEVARRVEAEEKLTASELATEELRERGRKDAQDHAAELRKHKAAFVELASSQRHLEAELARAARRADSAEAELKAAQERRDEAAATAAELSAEAARLRRDTEHKDKILSAMLRKSKIDREDREMLVREVKMSKARRKQAELEVERWRNMWESRGHRRGSRPSARCAAMDHPGCSDKLAPDTAGCAHDTKILFVDHVDADGQKNRQAAPTAPAAKDLTTVDCVDRYHSHADDKTVVEEYQDLQEWFQTETEKYTTMMRHRHSAEVEVFTEQLRLKDEKLEAFRWRAASTDAEVARLRRRVQELERSLSQHERHGAALEALFLERESEGRSLKEQLMALQERAIDSAIRAAGDEGDDARELCIPCSPVMIIQRTEPGEAEIAIVYRDNAEIKLAEPASPENGKEEEEATEPYDVAVLDDACDNVPTDHEDRCEIVESKEVFTDRGNLQTESGATARSEEVVAAGVALSALPEQKPSAWKMNIHALAVSYKIKRLKQQLVVLEKLAAAGGKEAKPSSNEGAAAGGGGGGREQPRSYRMMTSFLSKHVKRYQSLEDKIDDLCTRMEESKRSSGARVGERESAGSSALGRFLEETFQLQRYMVATGQKLLEMQSRIAPSLARRHGGGGGGEEDGVDMGRFMGVVGALLRDVQRGLEVRIARIIGDLEGTLAFHGISRTAS